MWISRPTRYVVLILWLSFYYLAYRFILQFNSHLTSPTYTDTPTILQTAKNVSLLSVILLYWLWGRKQEDAEILSPNKWLVSIYSFLIIFPLFLFIINPQPYFIEVGSMRGELP